jgi:hypothetical protein
MPVEIFITFPNAALDLFTIPLLLKCKDLHQVHFKW